MRRAFSNKITYNYTIRDFIARLRESGRFKADSRIPYGAPAVLRPCRFAIDFSSQPTKPTKGLTRGGDVDGPSSV